MKVYKTPKTAFEKEHNKKTLLLAESIKAKKLLELQHVDNGFEHLVKNKEQLNFIEYFQKLTEDRYSSQGNYGNWDSVLKHLIAFTGDYVDIHEIDAEWVSRFKLYLQDKAMTKSNNKLSQNTLHSYFNKFKAAFNTAYNERLIEFNPCSRVEGFKQVETHREFLTLEELKRLVKTPCEVEILKNAFLFSCLTGLRWSDINKLTWEELQFSEEQGWYIRYRQQKTNSTETLPVSEQALNFIPERGHQKEFVFKGLKYSAWYNLKLQQWVLAAGIARTITFHCARHTYATLQLTLGTDIYTVSKLLGHRELKTTQVYAKIIDQKKIEAANVIPNISI